MSEWTPDWNLTINGGGDYTNLTLANLTITSGRQDIYSQPYAGYCNVEILNLDLSPIEIDVNDQSGHMNMLEQGFIVLIGIVFYKIKFCSIVVVPPM